MTNVDVTLQASTDSEPLYVVEVLLHCSKDSVKDAATEAARPAAAGETGEMQVGEGKATISTLFHDLGRKFVAFNAAGLLRFQVWDLAKPSEFEVVSVGLTAEINPAVFDIPPIVMCFCCIQVVPVMLHLLTSISSVRLYIPKDLRPFDNRQLMLKSIQVGEENTCSLNETQI